MIIIDHSLEKESEKDSFLFLKTRIQYIKDFMLDKRVASRRVRKNKKERVH